MNDRIYILLYAGAASLLLAGCASTDPQTSWPEPEARRSVEGDLSVEPPAPVEPTGKLTLKQAQELALAGNPALHSYAHAVLASEARVSQARRLPNPELEVVLGEYDRDGAGYDSAEVEVALAQSIELGRKRHWRTRVAEAEDELAGWDYEGQRLDVFAETAERFIAVLAAQRRLGLAGSTIDVAEKTYSAVVERVNAGKEPPLQASKAAAELEMARMELREVENDLRESRRDLAAMWGSANPGFESAKGDLLLIVETIPPMDVLRERMSSNPELARWDAELKLRRAALSSEKAARIPDVDAMIGMQRFEEDGTDSLAFGIGVPLPLFDRNQGQVQAASHELAGAEASKRALEIELAGQLTATHEDLVASHEKVKTLWSLVVPAMEEAFSSAHVGYQEGKFGFLDMLDAQRGLFEARVLLVDALEEYHAAWIGIQRATGTIGETFDNENVEK